MITITDPHVVTDALASITNALSTSSAPGERAANRAVELMQDKMTGPKHGRMYGSHQASAPGEAPAVEEGSIVNGFRVESSGPTTNIYNTSDHWMHMEYGTINIAPRPFVTTTLVESANELEQIYSEEVAAIVESLSDGGATQGSRRVAQGGSGGSRSNSSTPARRVAAPRNVLK